MSGEYYGANGRILESYSTSGNRTLKSACNDLFRVGLGLWVMEKAF